MKTCPSCGKEVPESGLHGLCPECMLKAGVPTEEGAQAARGPHGTKVIPPLPPTAEEIAKFFPQLEILECLGRGGMGVVYKARQPRLNRLVALKVLAPEREKDPQFAERFTREAQALARLNHPNIVAVYDFGEANGLYYLLMEYVDGVSLRRLLLEGKLAPDQAMQIVPRICEALQYAHEQGLVHRDIKPENLLVDQKGRVKIADFGIAKILGAQTHDVVLTGAEDVVGTPHYMAPEQVEKPRTVDHRADIYSVGVVFYEMLTGELPLGKFAPPSRKVEVDVRLDEVVLRALEKEPDRRYQQAGQVKSDVETIVGTPGGVPPVAVPPVVKTAPGNENIWQQVKGPGTGLIAAGVLSWISIPLILIISFGFQKLLALYIPFAIAIFSSTTILAGLKMKRLEAYWLAIVGSILGILIMPGNLIGLPAGLWALVVLARPEVRAAFAAQKRGLPPSDPNARRETGGIWKLFAVVLGTLFVLTLLSLGLYLGSVFVRGSNSSQPAAAKQNPGFVLQGIVTDAVTGKPIAGARVADDVYRAHSSQPPRETWTDSEGRYQLPTWPEEHNLVASAVGYEPQILNIVSAAEVSAKQPKEAKLNFILQPSAKLNSSPGGGGGRQPTR